MSRQFCKRTCSVPDRFFDDSKGLHSGSSLVKIVDRVSFRASRRLKKCKFTISESFECDINCNRHGVTFTQNSNKIDVAMLSLEKTDTCSRYTVHSWHKVNAWNSDDMCRTEVFDCSTKPAKIV